AGIFAVNRRGGALWAFAEEPGVAHAVARSRDLAAILYAEVLELRVTGSSLKPLDPKSGFVADLKARTFQAAAEAPPQTERTAWGGGAADGREGGAGGGAGPAVRAVNAPASAPRYSDIAIIGTGFGGLGAAVRLTHAGFRDFVLLERAGDVGGTWRDNTYPGC